MKIPDRFTDEIDARREELMEWSEDAKEDLARRAAEIREQFAENVTKETMVAVSGWTMLGAGVVWGVLGFTRSRRRFGDLIGPIGLIAMGAAVLGGSTIWQRRAAHISEAEMRVREEMASLDPIARVRILKDLAGETVPWLRRSVRAG